MPGSIWAEQLQEVADELPGLLLPLVDEVVALLLHPVDEVLGLLLHRANRFLHLLHLVLDAVLLLVDETNV